MSFLDDALANTVGVVYRGATGNVDPWTKNQIIEEAAEARVRASGGTIPIEQATIQASQDVTQILTTFSIPGETHPVGADPSQALAGLKNSLSLAGDYGMNIGKTIMYAGIGAALLYGVFLLAQSGLLRKKG